MILPSGGLGVTQLIEEILADDLASRAPSLRHLPQLHAEDELPEDRSVFLRGPQGTLNSSAPPPK